MGNVHNPITKSENATNRLSIGTRHQNNMPFARYLTHWVPNLLSALCLVFIILLSFGFKSCHGFTRNTSKYVATGWISTCILLAK